MKIRVPLIPISVRVVAVGFLLGMALANARAEAIRVGFDSILEPVAYVDAQGQAAGFAADYMRAVAREAGLTVELVTGRKEDLQAQFRDGQLTAIAVLAFSEERAKVLDFTLPSLTLNGAVFTRKGGVAVATIADLKGRKIAISRGNFTHTYMLAHPELGVELMPLASTELALRAVQEGSCDGAVGVDLVAQKIIRERQLDRVVRSPVVLPGLVFKYHMAVRKGDAALLRRLNEAQLAIHERGEYAEIYEKWIGPLHTPGITWRQARPFAIPAGLLVMVIAVAFTMQRRTMRKLSQQAAALRESEARLNLVLEGGQHCLWDWKVRENRVVRGPMLAEMLGYAPHEIEPTPEGLTRLLHPDDQPQSEMVRNVITQPGPGEFLGEARLRTKDGGWRWVWTVGRVLERGPDGRAIRAVGTHTDITRRKEAEETVRRMNHELEQRVGERTTELATRVTEVERLNQELESFSYSVSHDLRAPLRNITGFLELLTRRLDAQLDAESARFVGTVKAEAKRMGTLIDDLLSLSRVGRTELVPRKVSLDDLAAEARHTMQPEIGNRVVTWKVGPLPVVSGDRALLLLALHNLLRNAVKFTRHRAEAVIEIGVGSAAGAEPGFVTIFVRDNGAGFNPKYTDKLFGVFQRLHNQRDFEGTGIGLANVKRIVTRHGGRVWADGAVDHGATFYFTLRAA